MSMVQGRGRCVHGPGFQDMDKGEDVSMVLASRTCNVTHPKMIPDYYTIFTLMRNLMCEMIETQFSFLPSCCAMDWRKKTLEPEDVALPTSKRLKSSASLSWKTATLDGHVPVKASPATLSWKQVGLVDEEASSKPSGSNFVKDEKAEPRVVTLTSQIISCIPTEVKQTTKYSEAGKNSDRIAGLLQLPCKCSKRTCFQQFKFKEVKPLLNLWHGLADVSKISLLTALSHDLTESNTESPDDDSVLEEGRRRYSLCGKDVCFKAFAVECVFEIKKLAANMEVTSQNALSQLTSNIKFDTFEYGDGKLASVMMRLKFIEQSSSPAGIYPQKPGLFLKAPLEIKQGKTYKIG